MPPVTEPVYEQSSQSHQAVRRLRPAGALAAGFVLIALVHALVLGVRLPSSGAIWWAVQGVVAGQLLGMGLACAAVIALIERASRRVRRLAMFALLVPLVLVLRWLLREDATGPAERLSSHLSEDAVTWLFGVGGALGLLAAWIVGRLLARPRLRWVGAAIGAVVAGVNAVSLPLAYPGVHWVVAVGAATLAGAGFVGLPVPQRTHRRPWLEPACAGAGLALTLPSFVATPSNAVLLELLRQPAAIFVPFLSRLRPELDSDLRVPAKEREWFVDRSGFPPIPPSNPPLPLDVRLVFLIGVDSLRADLLEREEYRARFPELFRLRDEGVWFANARAPGASTAPSLAALFSGVYYSQLYWSLHKRRQPEVFPHQDPTLRFPELLKRAGIGTRTVDPTGWLLNTFGIVRGFSQEESARKGGYPSSKVVVRRLLAQLSKRDLAAERNLSFAHFLDAHAPYTSAGAAPSPFEGYLKELERVDEAIGRVRRFVRKKKMEEHTLLVVFADHGEAFGEHGLKFHGSTLYDVMIRVPVLVQAPGLRARRVDAAVTLVDLGPTILDLFGLATPPHMMGQTLVPFLRGDDPELTRPILAEARLKRALLTPRGEKVVYDTRSKTVEVYDLVADPGEENNLYSGEDPRSQELLDTLLAFFAEHTHRRPGYEVPYRKW